jgi:hypothetical protein
MADIDPIRDVDARKIRDADRPTATAARVDASSTSGGALVHTKDLKDFKFPDDRPDPRGWDALIADGTKVGKIEDLLVDSDTGTLRYLELAVADDIVKAGGRDFVLVPVGEARLDDDRDNVIVNLTLDDLRNVPVYDRQELSRDYERKLHGFLDERPRAVRATERATERVVEPRVTAADLPADRTANFYAGPRFDDSRFFGSRRAGLSGAADRATSSGIADRIADKVDDLKDRVDANPASKPGPDPTDRPIGRA